MCLITTLKGTLKEARKSGKIYIQQWRTYDPASHLVGNNPGEFGGFARRLSDEEWLRFEAEERAFRKTLDTKLIDDRQRITYTGTDPTQWNKLMAILNGIYHKNGTFSAHNRNGRPYGIPLLKYTVRILNKLPNTDKPPTDRTPEALTEWIEKQFRFMREVIQPALNRTTRTQQKRLPRKVSRDEIAYLWNNNRTKAIRVILNNSTFTEPLPSMNDTERVYKYYCDKNQADATGERLATPPWLDALELNPPTETPNTSLFTSQEVLRVIESLPNNKACGSDGVTYETLKSTKQWTCTALTQIFNVCMTNEKIPDSWKGALIHRIPKKDNIPDNPATWRDISLLPTIYKVLMKCILNRILPWLCEMNILSEKQKAYINRQGMNEHVFCLKTAIDDFKHESTKFYAVFLDFRDAFGSLPHSVMIKSLDEINIPTLYINIIKDIYRNSFIQVICGDQLTRPIQLRTGIKTGCPWSAVNFILALNQWLKWLCLCSSSHIRSPNPVQAYADDVQVSSRDEKVIKTMLSHTDKFMRWSGLEVKNTKCAVFYERRSGGNRWYQAKKDKPPSFSIMGNEIKVYARHETYCYLGHRFNIAGEWEEQIHELSSEYCTRLDMVDSSPLPVAMKLQAIREIALSKIQHLFANIHIPKCILNELNNKTVSLARRWIGLNTHSTRDVLFHRSREGGLGVPHIEWVYTAARISNLLRMLNNDDAAVRELARASLLLHLGKRKVPLCILDDASFLGFRRKPSGKLDTNTPGFGVRSDWLDLNDLCNRANIQLRWRNTAGQSVEANENICTDPTITAEATITTDDNIQLLDTQNIRRTIIDHFHLRMIQHWTGLRLQGQLACLPCADQNLSHTVLKNTALQDDIYRFTIKARLQVLPTKSNLATWFPSAHEPFCLQHHSRQRETIAHILNGCSAYKGLYIARHDRIVALSAKELRDNVSHTTIHCNEKIKTDWFPLPHEQCVTLETATNHLPNTPDIFVINEHTKAVTIIEIGCSFDAYMDTCYASKLLKYQPWYNVFNNFGYSCKVIALIFGSLGHVHKLCVRGLQICGLHKNKAKKLTRYCSVSAVIGSLYIWRRRCHLYP